MATTKHTPQSAATSGNTLPSSPFAPTNFSTAHTPPAVEATPPSPSALERLLRVAVRMRRAAGQLEAHAEELHVGAEELGRARMQLEGESRVEALYLRAALTARQLTTRSEASTLRSFAERLEQLAARAPAAPVQQLEGGAP